MWQAFCLASNLDINTKHDSFKFCGGGLIGDELTRLVLNGTKTATSSVKLVYDLGDELLPQVGDLSIVLYDDGSPACIIEETRVSVVSFNKVSKEHAYKEGEGKRTLEEWKKVHFNFFKAEYEEYGYTFNENENCVLEEFKVVYK